MPDLIEPDDDSPDSEAFREELLRKNLAPRYADAITSWFYGPEAISWWPNVQPEPKELDTEHRLDSLVHWAGDAFSKCPSESTALLKFVSDVVDWGILRNRDGRRVRVKGAHDVQTGERLAVATVLLPRVLALDIAIPTALRTAATAGIEIRARRIIEIVAIHLGALHPRDVLDMTPLRAWDRWDRPAEPGNNDPASTAYWLVEHGRRGLEGLGDVIREEPDETLGRVASAILAVVEIGLGAPGFGEWTLCRDGTPVVEAGEMIAAWTAHLVDRAARREGDVYLLSALFESTEVAYRLTQKRLSDDLATRVAKVAGRALGLLRKCARERGADCDLVGTQTGRWAYGQALLALSTTEGLGSSLTNGTLLLRALQEAAVGDDLRPWPDPPLPLPPERWSWLPSSMNGLIHNIGHYEQREDPHLIEARTVFALFLLDRLKPGKGKTEGPKEPDATWRRCCIRALRELAVNPDGHVHKVLHKVIQEDPDPQVQVAARTAYDQLRRADPTTDDVSPRRRLMAATWWLRQANRLALGLDVDAAGARRTRNREISRTRERKEVSK